MTQEERYQVLPGLTAEEYSALRDDIAEHGVMIPVEVDEDGVVLDGHHRVQACAELGIRYPVVVRSGLTETEKRRHARRANLLRRHLTREQRRQVIADVLADEPDLSDRAVSRLVGCSPSTVAAVRHRVSNLDTAVVEPPAKAIEADVAPRNKAKRKASDRPAHLRGTRYFVADRIVEKTVSAVETMAFATASSQDEVEYQELDRTRVQEWTERLHAARRDLNRNLTRISRQLDAIAGVVDGDVVDGGE